MDVLRPPRARPSAGESSGTSTTSTQAPAQEPPMPSTPRFERETEKAVLAKISIDSNGEIITRTAWIPKSQIKDGKPSDWIVRTKAREILEQRHPNTYKRYTELFEATVMDADNRELTTTYYNAIFMRR